MTTRLEILSETNGTLGVALYYEVPENRYNPLSADQTRVPAGSALTAQEVTQLKQGRLVEVLDSIQIGNKKRPELREALEKLWRESAEDARRQYRRDYNYIGRSWDGTWR